MSCEIQSLISPTESTSCFQCAYPFSAGFLQIVSGDESVLDDKNFELPALLRYQRVECD